MAHIQKPAPEPFDLLKAMQKAIDEGRVDRSAIPHDIVSPGVDANTGVRSKDAIIPLQTAISATRELPRHASLGEKELLKATALVPPHAVSARLYMPGNAIPGKKLPLVVFYHGGAFAFHSAYSQIYHKHLNMLVHHANVVAVSVDYRLAPEYPVPTAYHDSWVALKWATSRSTGDEWLQNYADMDRLFLGGDSAGGNIAHHMALWVGLAKHEGINLIGVFLNCPYFFYDDDDKTESFADILSDKGWRLVCPGTVGHRDDPRFNPVIDPDLHSLGCTRIRIYTGEKDFVRGGCYTYKEAVSKSGWHGRIDLLEYKGEDHVFSVDNPESENGAAMLKNVASFINDYKPLLIRSAICYIDAPAGVDAKTGVRYKDVTIPLETAEYACRDLPRDASLGEKKLIQATATVPVSAVTARLYMPGNATRGKKLPLVVYFHGGGFAFHSSSSETGANDVRLNPTADMDLLSKLGCDRVLACTAEKDFLRESGRHYYEGLKKGNWKGVAEFFETPGEEHVFHLQKPSCDNAFSLMKRIVEFVNSAAHVLINVALAFLGHN